MMGGLVGLVGSEKHTDDGGGGVVKLVVCIGILALPILEVWGSRCGRCILQKGDCGRHVRYGCY